MVEAEVEEVLEQLKEGWRPAGASFSVPLLQKKIKNVSEVQTQSPGWLCHVTICVGVTYMWLLKRYYETVSIMST